ncbi:hypothetical protein Pint_05148 [Pistacia integerrima]|uniref:Uncharacterized protein n=1 Tax=Pistacia integerrima TaxID=434235 RepID=A0ACC0Z441_9ROSI|nr:hypothetical protein Pint_05148 [Pistacia integerrima]
MSAQTNDYLIPLNQMRMGKSCTWEIQLLLRLKAKEGWF